MRTRGRATAILTVCAGLAMAACDRPPSEPDNAPIVAERSSTVLSAGAGLARTAAFFEGAPNLAMLDPDQAAAAAIALVRTRIQTVFGPTGCAPTVDTDGSTYIAANFDDCALRFLDIDGEVRADLDVLTQPCERGSCPTDLRWRVDGPGLEISTPRGDSRPVFSGPFEVTATLSTPRLRWRTDEQFEVDVPLGVFRLASDATWTVIDECVHLDLEARFELRGGVVGPELDIGTISVGVDGLVRCQDRCPSSGAVRVAWGAGKVAGWTHDGSDVIEVVGPRGYAHDVDLPCTPAD